jgi:riboflavin synthase
VFTGLVEAIGTIPNAPVRSGGGFVLDVAVTWPDSDVPKQGDSVAINGACLTAIDPTRDGFRADVSPESIERTLLGELRPGDSVNVERALKLGDRIGGHLVQGHVDGVARVMAIIPQGSFSRWKLSLPAALAPEVAEKGSIAVNGVSLTVASVAGDSFEVALIPETLQATTLKNLRVGDRLHLETDVLAKYVARRLEGRPSGAIEALFGPEAKDASS